MIDASGDLAVFKDPNLLFARIKHLSHASNKHYLEKLCGVRSTDDLETSTKLKEAVSRLRATVLDIADVEKYVRYIFNN